MTIVSQCFFMLPSVLAVVVYWALRHLELRLINSLVNHFDQLGDLSALLFGFFAHLFEFLLFLVHGYNIVHFLK